MSPAPTVGFDPDELAPWESQGPRIRSTFASTVTPTSPEWLWSPWLLRRGLNLLTARQGAGKTTFAAHLVAAVTRGLALPGDEARDPVRVGFLSLEEPDDRLVARLTAANATLDAVILFGDVEDVDDEGNRFRRRWQLPKDVQTLGAAVDEYEVALVIVDGLGYAITGTSHNYAQVGSALAALAAEADRTGAAILGLVHPPKGAADAVTAAIGSTAWTAIPRVCWVMGLDPHDETGTTRVLSVGKSNYKMPPSSLAFGIGEHPTLECGVVTGLRPTAVTADEVMAAPATHEERTERADARDFLRELLADGPMASDEVSKLAEQAGISRRTIERARRDVGVVSSRRTDPKTGRLTGWTVALAATPPHRHTTPPAFETWRSGRSGPDQGKYSPSLPDRQPTESGGLDATVVRFPGVVEVDR